MTRARRLAGNFIFMVVRSLPAWTLAATTHTKCIAPYQPARPVYRRVTSALAVTRRHKNRVRPIRIRWIIASMNEAIAVQRLLVVDDDVDIRTLLAEQLSKAGYAVSTAGNGAEMRRVLEREHVDLVVLDLNLPKKTASPSAGTCGPAPARP